MAGEIRVSIDAGVTTIVIANPDRKNAVSSSMLADLRAAVAEAEGTSVILTGAGDIFCSGADLAELEEPARARLLEENLAAAADAIAACRVPVIAAIEGACLGAGVELAAACDVRVVSEAALFEVPATRLGLLYRPAGLQRLARTLGPHAVRRLLLVNERMDAHALGSFAAPLVPVGEARSVAVLLAHKVGALSSTAVEATKQLLAELDSGEVDWAAWDIRRTDLFDARY